MKLENKSIANQIKSTIRNKDPKAEVILFGSRARGQENKDSDWDILVLLDLAVVDRQTERDYRERLFELELETGEAISTFVFSKQDWKEKYAATPFFQSVVRDGIHL